MVMGALLAIPTSTTMSSLDLSTTAAMQLFWTLQNYGAYIVDDTFAAGFALAAEEGAHGSKPAEFLSDWGFSMQARVTDNTAWMRDMQKLIESLWVVGNNSAGAVGGGGTPLQPLAPDIGSGP